MPSRAELNLRAASAGVVAANFPNDSQLERAVIVAEEAKTPTTAEVRAQQTLTVTGNAIAGETITVAGVTYVFVTAANLSNGTPNQIVIGATASDTLDNLKAAISPTAVGAGTQYSYATAASAVVTPTTKTATTLLFVANNPGVKGNLMTSTETMSLGSFGAATFAGGVNGTGPKASDIAAIS